MELLNQEEILYKISDTELRSKSAILNYKIGKTLYPIPDNWRIRNFTDITDSIMKPISEKLTDWDFKKPTIAGIISVQNGIGKTHLATCVWKKYINTYVENELNLYIEKYNEGDEYAIRTFLNKNLRVNERCLFLSEKKLALTIQETFNSKSKSQLEVMEYYCNLDFLIIDDCFAMKQNEFARQNIFYIIDERSEWKNKPTFITSNLSLREIADIDTRIADRIRTSMLFEIKDKVKSYRELQ
jgi:chromosomal replication initiation ATPase DnaA